MNKIYIRIVGESNTGYIIEDSNKNKMNVTKKEIALALKNGKVYSDNIALCFDTNRIEMIIDTSRDEHIGKKIDNWNVIAITEKDSLYCECCKCKKTHIINKGRINNMPKCKCVINVPKECLTGKHFGEWTVLEYNNNGTWKCKCSCENGTIQNIKTNYLTSGKSKSCGCISNKQIELKGKTINEWEVLEYVGDRMWKCRCSCNKIKNVHAYTLMHNLSKNCGDGMHMLQKFGEMSPQKFNKPREKWQIDTIEDKEMLYKFIIKSDNKCSEYLANKLGVTKSTFLIKVHKHGLEEFIHLNTKQSFMETQVADFIKSIYKGEIIQNSRKILTSKKELDIYIPEFKLAIEINGNYFHSALYKDKMYHYNKFEECKKLGIRLIQIYEYEYSNEINKNIINDIIRRALRKTCTIINARDTDVRYVDTDDEKKFLSNNHIQGYTTSQRAYGIYFKGELKQLISVGTPRFNNRYDLEIIRECSLLNTMVVGGFEKIYSKIMQDYNSDTIISYCSNDKFTGTSYLKNQFKCIEESEPGYVWLDINKNTIIPRYKTMKHNLIKLGFGNKEQTETEIMTELGYTKIYNSGNLTYLRRNKT